MTSQMRESTMPNMPTSSTRFGIVFASQSDATAFAEKWREEPVTCEPIGTRHTFTFRLSSPEDDATKTKGMI